MSQQSAASIVAQDKRRRQHRRRPWLIATGVVAGLVLFGFFGLPPIVRAQAVKHLSAALKREVSIEKIRINPLVLSVTIEGLNIKDLDGGPFTRWDRLYVNFDSFSVFTGEWHFQQIALDGFSQRVAIAKDGSFNFADLIPPPADKPAAEAPASPVPTTSTLYLRLFAGLTSLRSFLQRSQRVSSGPLGTLLSSPDASPCRAR